MNGPSRSAAPPVLHPPLHLRPFRSAERVPVLTADESRAWDRRTIDEAGVPERVLMESAGRCAAAVVHRLHPRGRVVALVGSGNNGGDAVVALRALRSWGREVTAVQVGSSMPDAALRHGWEVETRPFEALEDALAGAAVVVDGLLGTGSSGAPRGAYAGAIETVGRTPLPVVALDVPSGIDPTEGTRPGAAIRAEATVTFGAPKRGLLRHPGRAHAGRILAVEIGLAPIRDDERGALLLTRGWARAHLPAIPPDAHKGTLGLVAVVAGSAEIAGAALLAGQGALRAGAGKVRIVSDAANRTAAAAALPEALFVGRGSDGVEERVGDADAVVAGPGMGTDDAAAALLRRVLAAGAIPLLLDADALTLLSRDPSLRDDVGDRPLLLTPHPGEMGRLLDRSTSDVIADPFAAAAEAAERFRCTVLLKGAPSLVAETGAPTRVGVTGHAGVGTGGTGDTLAGIAGTFLAQGASPLEAAGLALWCSGRAAELAGRGRALLPRDVAEALPAALAEAASSGYDPLAEEDGEGLGLPFVTLDLPRAE